MATTTLQRPALADNAETCNHPALQTLREMDEQIEFLRKANPETEAVLSLHFLVKRARGEIRRQA